MKTSQPVSTTPGQLRRCLTSALLTLSLMVGTIVTTPAPAEAASVVLGCFTALNFNYTASGIPVVLQMWDGVSLRPAGYGVVGGPGNFGTPCIAFNIPPSYQNYPFQFRVRIDDSRSFNGKYFSGETAWTPWWSGSTPSFVQGAVTCTGSMCNYYR